MQVANRNRETRATVVLAVLCFVLQLTLAPNVGLGNGRANFALVFTACYSLAHGAGRSTVFVGFVSGLLFDLSSSGPIGLMSFCLALAGYALGLGMRDRMAGDFASSVVSVAVASVAVSLIYHLAMLLVGQTSSIIDALFLRTLPTALLTLVAFLPFAYYLSRVRSRGSSLGGGRHSARSLGGRGLQG